MFLIARLKGSWHATWMQWIRLILFLIPKLKVKEGGTTREKLRKKTENLAVTHVANLATTHRTAALRCEASRLTLLPKGTALKQS